MSSYIIKKNLYPLFKLAIPLVMTGMLQSSIFFFETLFIAHLGQQKLAAGALVSWLFGTMVVILFGTLGSINVLIAHKHGANDEEGIALVMRDGLLLALLLTIPAFLLFWNMAPIFLLLGQSPAIVVLAKTYLHALAWGLLPTCIMIAFLELIMGLGHARTIMIFTIIQVLLNIFFSFVLIFGKWGFPAFGIAGAGWGMTVSNWLSVMILVSYVLTNRKYKPYFKGIFNRKKSSFLWELLRVGAPMGVMYCIEVAFFFCIDIGDGIYQYSVACCDTNRHTIPRSFYVSNFFGSASHYGADGTFTRSKRGEGGETSGDYRCDSRGRFNADSSVILLVLADAVNFCRF